MKKLALVVIAVAFGVMGVVLLSSENHDGEWRVPNELEAYLFDEHPAAPKTDALLIWRDGVIIKERYARGFTADSRHLLWSISKSITSSLIGRAIHQKLIHLDDPLSKFYEKKALKESARKSAITVDQLLLMSSGLNWQETYENTGDRTLSSVGQMLYGDKASVDAVEYVLSHPLLYEPGSQYRYSTGDTTVLLNILKSVYGDGFVDMPWTELFDKLGMQTVSFEQDGSGQFLSGSNIYMRARDLLKFGQLHLQEGVWEGERLLPEQWNQFVWSINPVYYNSKYQALVTAPGRHWWTNHPPDRPGRARFTSLPLDTVFALGHWDQYLIIIPSLNIIVVRLGDDHHHELSRDIFFDLLSRELGL